jgi:hypothetical protein
MSPRMTVSLPRDIRYAATARLIALQSARDCGCAAGAVDAFAGDVEDVARISLATSDVEPHVVMAVERTADALVVTIDSQVMQLAL